MATNATINHLAFHGTGYELVNDTLNVTVFSSQGTAGSIPSYDKASTSQDGLMSKEDKTKLDNFKTADQYVTVVSGKDLSTNDFTTAYKEQLDNLASNPPTVDTSQFVTDEEFQEAISAVAIDTSDFVTTTQLQTAIDNATVDTSQFVQKDGTKVLSDVNYTQAEKTKLEGIEAGAQVNKVESIKVDGTALPISDKAVNIVLSGKVDTVAGKQLSTNDFTNDYKNKIDGATVKASTSQDGLMSKEDYSKLSSVEAGANKYVLSKATSASLGGVKIVEGNGLYMDGDTLKVNATEAQGDFSLASTVASGLMSSSDKKALESLKAITDATTVKSGYMSTSDKIKLNGIDTLYATKSEVSSAVASVYKPKGSVNSFSDLPSNASEGDVYNIKTAGGTDVNGNSIKAGDNVVKVSNGWDVLAGTVDLSGYATTVVASTSQNGLMSSSHVQALNSAFDRSTVMGGATASANGSNGYVPAPVAGQQNALLRGDATWANVGEGFYFDNNGALQINNATSEQKGIAKVGDGLISRGGSLHAAVGTGLDISSVSNRISLKAATNNSLGGIIPDTVGMSMDGNYLKFKHSGTIDLSAEDNTNNNGGEILLTGKGTGQGGIIEMSGGNPAGGSTGDGGTIYMEGVHGGYIDMNGTEYGGTIDASSDYDGGKLNISGNVNGGTIEASGAVGGVIRANGTGMFGVGGTIELKGRTGGTIDIRGTADGGSVYFAPIDNTLVSGHVYGAVTFNNAPTVKELKVVDTSLRGGTISANGQTNNAGLYYGQGGHGGVLNLRGGDVIDVNRGTVTGGDGGIIYLEGGSAQTTVNGGVATAGKGGQIHLGAGGTLFAGNSELRISHATVVGDSYTSIQGNVQFVDKPHFNQSATGISLQSGDVNIPSDTYDSIMGNFTLTGNETELGYTLPTASQTVKGGIMVGNCLSMTSDSLNVTFSNKTIESSNANLSFPSSTIKSHLSTIEVRNSNIDVSGASIGGGAFQILTPVTLTSSARTTFQGDVIFTGTPTFENGANGIAYSLPSASQTVKGGVKVGKALKMTNESIGVDTLEADDVYITESDLDSIMNQFTVNSAAPAGYFSDPITVTGGFNIPDSVSSSFGSYNTVTAGNNMLVSAGNITIVGATTFTNNTRFNGGIKVADSMSVDIGAHGSLISDHTDVDFKYSNVKLNSATVSGDPVFTSRLTFNQGFTTGNSITSSFGNYNTVNADHTYFNLNQSDIRVNQATFTGIPTLNSGFKTAESITTSFGNYDTVNFNNYSVINVKNNSTVLCDHAYVDLGASKMKFSNSTITGNPTFTGTPKFNNGISTNTVMIPSSTFDSIMENFVTVSSAKSTPTIVFDPTSISKRTDLSAYSLTYTVTSDATSHTHYFIDSYEPEDIHQNTTVSGLSGSFYVAPVAGYGTGTHTFYIQVPETTDYKEGIFTYQVEYENV